MANNKATGRVSKFESADRRGRKIAEKSSELRVCAAIEQPIDTVRYDQRTGEEADESIGEGFKRPIPSQCWYKSLRCVIGHVFPPGRIIINTNTRIHGFIPSSANRPISAAPKMIAEVTGKIVSRSTLFNENMILTTRIDDCH
jgi:hypothetical protein